MAARFSPFCILKGKSGDSREGMKISERPLFLWLKYLKRAGKCGMISSNILIEGMNSYGNEHRSDKRGWDWP